MRAITIYSDHSDINEKILRTLQTLKNTHGKNMQIFLKDALCVERGMLNITATPTSCTTLDNYEKAETVDYMEIRLLEDRRISNAPWLSATKEDFLERMELQMQAISRVDNWQISKYSLHHHFPNTKNYGATEVNHSAIYSNGWIVTVC